MVDVLNEVIIPLVGLITATVLFASPARAMLVVDRTRTVGPLNIFPMAMIGPNCLAWMFYGIMTDNLWLWWSNLPSFLLGLWYMSIALRATDLSQRHYRMIQAIMGGGLGLDSLGLMGIIALDDKAVRDNVMGAICIAVLVVFYTSPLSTLVQVLRTRDSSPFLLPLAITTALNGAAWSAFGFYLGDAFLYGPNILGAVNGVVQIVCCLLFPRTAVQRRRDAATARALDAAEHTFDAEKAHRKAAIRAKGFGCDGGFAPAAMVCEATMVASDASSPSVGGGLSASSSSPQLAGEVEVEVGAQQGGTSAAAVTQVALQEGAVAVSPV